MLPAHLTDALSMLATSFATNPELEAKVRARWRVGERNVGQVPAEVRAAADLVAGALPALTQSDCDAAELAGIFFQPAGLALLHMVRCQHPAAGRAACASAGGRRRRPRSVTRALAVVRDRVVEGRSSTRSPARRSSATAPSSRCRRTPSARAGSRILIWEAGRGRPRGAGARPLALGLAGDLRGDDPRPAHGALRGRVLAARCLEVSVGGHAADDRSRARRADAPGAAAAAPPSRAARLGARRARARSAHRAARAARGHAARLGPRRLAASCASAR